MESTVIMEILSKIVDNWSSCKISVLYNKINSVEYVSFDIFDTLLKRDVPKPTDVFMIVERQAKEKDFYKKRIKAEELARRKNMNKEITLDDIYACYSGDRISVLEEIEIATEIALSTINKEIFPLFQYALKNSKVILISDMYLSRKVIKQLLENNGISNFWKLYISNEYDMTKTDGSLFKYVCSDLKIKPNNILHIGNSFRADYLSPKRIGLLSCKIGTYKRRLQRNYKPKEGGFDNEALDAFLNNHVDFKDMYIQFGYEVFGPLLYGFIQWIYNEAKKDKIQQVFFLSRDGFVMKKLYDLQGYNKDIPSFYIEVSRRSLRVPRLSKQFEFEKVMSGLSVPNMTNVTQIFDSLGLDAKNYREQIEKRGINFSQQVKRDSLIHDKRYKKLYEDIREDVKDNAHEEYIKLVAYLQQFDFLKKTAIVDIGWVGSMQNALVDTLHDMHIDSNIYGYYVGLTKRSKQTLEGQKGKAKGFAFDCYNNQDNELESAYVGLIETMFLEQDGSVKRYIQTNDRIVAERYPYEYQLPNGDLMPEADIVRKIQEGAFQFAIDYNSSILSHALINDSKMMYYNMHKVGTDPNNINIVQFGKISFFNCGNQVYLANPQSLVHYILNFDDLKRDIYDSQWKIGFLKALFKIKLPYNKIFQFLRRKANQ